MSGVQTLENTDDALRASLEAAAAAAQSHLASALNQIVRRMRQYETEQDWVNTLLDGTQLFASTAALFQVDGSRLRCRGAREVDPPDSFEVKLCGAFDAAVSSKEPVVALRTPGEVGPALAASDRRTRAHIIPILNKDRVVALIFAAGNPGQTSDGLELLASLAGFALERKTASDASTIQIAAAPAASATAPKRKSPQLPAWAALPEADRSAHLQAQRFARTAVASMLLLRPETARAGLEQNDLYLFLKNEINAARDSYRDQFSALLSMVDYLHLELLACGADGDEEKLGPEYPGPLM